MPEGDTLFRTADVLRRAQLGSQARAARGRPGGARLPRLVGSHVTAVTTVLVQGQEVACPLRRDPAQGRDATG